MHPQAKANLDTRGDQLLAALGPPAPEHRPTRSSFEPETPIAATITEEDIIEIESSVADGRRITIARYFYDHQRGQLGLSGSSFDEFKAAAISIHRLMSDVASVRTVEDLVFRWCRDRTAGVSESTLTSYVERELESLVGNHEIWLPIATLYLERPLSLGSVILRTITAEHIDRLAVRWESVDGPRAAKEAAIAEFRGRLQGMAASTSVYRAERRRAEERAAEATEDALSMLRLFSAEILHPHGWSLCTVEGLDSLGGGVRFVLRDGVPVSLSEGFPRGLRAHWTISAKAMEELLTRGLRAADELLRESNRTDFERTLLGALRHYSIAALKKDPSEKLLYIVTALESLLLGGSEEGQIAQNFRDRFATLRGRDLSSRLRAQKRAAAIYALRSRFVHGGLPPQDLGLLEEFMMDAWVVLIALLKNRRFVQTKSQFLRTLDVHKMAGPPFGRIRVVE